MRSVRIAELIETAYQESNPEDTFVSGAKTAMGLAKKVCVEYYKATGGLEISAVTLLLASLEEDLKRRWT